MTTEADVRRICLSLPETTETPYEGLPGFRVRKRLFARIRTNPDALVVWTPEVGEKEALIAAEPEKFFQTPHYEGHPAVLVRLEAIEVDELEELLTESWALRAPARLVSAFEAVESGQLLMAYGSVEDDAEAFQRVANRVVAELRRVGLNASWHGTEGHPIVVDGIVWRRRR